MDSLLQFLFLLSLFPFISSIFAETVTTTIPLQHFSQYTISDPWEKLSQFASASLARATHIKNPKNGGNAPVFTDPMYAQSYGGYTIALNFGTPPQKLPFILDTGSDLVWFPCTKNYACRNCSFPNVKKIPSFLPKMSSSSKLIGCKNPKCKWIHGPEAQTLCRDSADCSPNSRNCSQICPPYAIQYGSGSTAGVLLSETLVLTNIMVRDFVVGCSLVSDRQPAGIAGFGRGVLSLQSQLAVRNFSFCLLSRRLDDTGRSSSLVLNGGSDSGGNLSFTTFLKNPTVGNPAFAVYYYVGLRKITVGDKRVKVPYKFLAPDSVGDGGTVIDSGSTFTYMESSVFEPVAEQFVAQVKYKRAINVETLTGLRPCFNISGEKTVKLPKFAFQFKGGADMDFPLANYFSFVGDSSTICLAIVTDGGSISGGPSVILGSFQLQNFYVAYDLEKERLGFRQQIC